ncbi:MAG: hypothetical protein J0H64_07180 [Actinobacteria bacterium]|nr:hypothetical protein [Actinomycetota bacterium]
MSDLEQDRPLTRRERRMLEMVETGAVPTIEAAEQRLRETAQSEPSEFASGDDIDISPLDENGRPRTRREMRALREQALAELGLSEVDAPETAPAAEDLPAAEAAAPQVVEQAAEAAPIAESTAAAEPELAATQPISLEDLRDLETEFPTAHAPVTYVPVGAEAAEGESVDEVPAADEPPAEAPAAAVAEAPEPEAPADGETATEVEGYSFPDITPLDDNVSVFDDPALRTVSTPLPATPGQETGDFDDLISRAVAQESATSTTNTSALILPSLPETDDLSGPLGGTGELFVTGSISLPKSLGETGGHIPMRDLGENDHLEDLGYDAVPATSNPILPVSATRAVSAVSSSWAVVKQETKEKSKLPIVLIATGGGLVIAVGALLIWAASSGMFG